MGDESIHEILTNIMKPNLVAPSNWQPRLAFLVEAPSVLVRPVQNCREANNESIGPGASM